MFVSLSHRGRYSFFSVFFFAMWFIRFIEFIATMWQCGVHNMQAYSSTSTLPIVDFKDMKKRKMKTHSLLIQLMFNKNNDDSYQKKPLTIFIPIKIWFTMVFVVVFYYYLLFLLVSFAILPFFCLSTMLVVY